MERIRDSFDRQGFMRTLGAVLESVELGYGVADTRRNVL
jgi:hypothetical protein